MPVAPRLRRAGRRVLAVLAVAVVLTVAGCQSLDDAGQVIDRADLVDDLASRLGRSADLTYSADYQLAGGAAASVAQEQRPRRAAYTYPGGKVTVTGDATTRCTVATRATTCTLSPPPSPAARGGTALFSAADTSAMVPPAVVTDLLTAAALDADAVIDPLDTTIAGRHASCVDVRNLDDAAASRFRACVTTEGVLGSFVGTVDGRPVEVTMTRYRDTVDDTAFALPDGARVVDRRPGRR